MAQTISAHDTEHFAAVCHALARDGLHLAMVCSDRERLYAYAGELSRVLSREHGLRVEAYQSGRLETIVADLMLHRFDAALSRISGSSQQRAHAQASMQSEPGCVLFIPEAQRLPLAEFAHLVRIASGTPHLRLVALLDGKPAFESESRVRAMGERVAHWTLDGEPPEEAMPAAPVRRARAPLPRFRTAHVSAAAAALLLLLAPVLYTTDDDAGRAATTATGRVTRSDMVELAGEPPADFRRAADEAQTPATSDSPAEER